MSFAAVQISSIILDRPPKGDTDFLGALVYEVYLETQKFNERSKHIKVELMAHKLQYLDIFTGVNTDLVLIQIAISMVGIYTAINIGGLSPIHCRCWVTICGLFTVALCYLAGFSLAFALNFRQSGVHNLISFLLIGIGVDDMFVVCNSID